MAARQDVPSFLNTNIEWLFSLNVCVLWALFFGVFNLNDTSQKLVMYNRVAGGKLEQPYVIPPAVSDGWTPNIAAQETILALVFLMDVVLLCIEQQLEGLDLAGDLNLADFGGVVQPPSQWCLAWERFILVVFFQTCWFWGATAFVERQFFFDPLFQVEGLERPLYSLSLFCLFDLCLGCCSAASISGMEILEVDWECLGSFNSRVSDQPNSENSPWD